ncbi:hypothetical protein ACFY4C_23080 [Actinomadura viridis]|uniref:hypothetical protein n=1 Tax=Actinomadura viridis TaxID=58110 RepID=UPI0036C06C16
MGVHKDHPAGEIDVRAMGARSSGGAVRRKVDRAVTVARVRLLSDLAIALAELGRSSRLLVETGGETVLTLRAGRGSVAVVVIQDGKGWAYLWDGAQRHPAGVGLDGLLRVAAALAAVVR